MSARPKVIVTRRLPAPVERALEERFDVRLNERDVAFDDHRMRTAMREAHALVPTVGDRLATGIFTVEPVRVRIIANYGVGTDHIDLAAAATHGITVTNTPDVLTDCTADLTIALMLAVLRRMGEAERELRGGKWTGWTPTHMLGARVTGRTLGIIGFGRIGQAVARRAHHGFGMRILFATRTPPSPDITEDVGARQRDLDDLLREATIISIHAPATADTRHLIGERELGLMRRDAFLINTARGGIVDEAALVAALGERRIAGAGLDVFDGEPAVRRELLDAPNVVLLPHIGSATLETRTAMGMRVVENLRAFFDGRKPPDALSARG
ncbi:MAG TPA: D-glycerate dehydrogenase [Longimicrobiales bacterium]|nr:D-glycerate dehydrogenase [Longimicrobiales bacterium]